MHLDERQRAGAKSHREHDTAAKSSWHCKIGDWHSRMGVASIEAPSCRLPPVAPLCTLPPVSGRSYPKPLTAVACAALLFSGCGGSSKVSASAYVKSVCTAVGDWATTIRSREGLLAAHLPTSPTQGRQALQSFIADVISSTGNTRSRIKSAGVPDVSHGQQISLTLVSAFDQIQGALRQAKSEADRLPTTSPTAFGASARQLGSSVEQTLSSIGSSLSGLRAAPLEKASSQTPACQSLKAA